MQQKKNETVHLLILDPSQNDAEKIVSLLRNSGRATRAHRITSEEDLLESLKNHTWDLCLAREIAESPSAEEVLNQINRLEKDIPFIVLNDGYNNDTFIKYLRAGAQDVVPFENSKHLILSISRELTSLSERRQRRTAQRLVREAEKRCQLLLDSSKDAIAYVNDGMHVYANPSYMEFYGYDDIDDLICIPVLDTLSDSSQDDFKEISRSFSDGEIDTGMLNCVACRSDESEINVVMSLSRATYEGEECTQIVVRPEKNSAELEEKLREISSQDLLTGLYNRQYLMEKLELTVRKATDNGVDSALLYIKLDQFNSVKSNVGIAGADLVFSDIANLLKQYPDEHDTLSRVSDDAFCLLMPDQDEEKARALSEIIRKAVENHLSDVSGKTVQLTCSIGIALIGENAPNALDMLGRAHSAADDVSKMEGHERGNGVNKFSARLVGESLEEGSAVDILQEALDENRFRLLFQPVISLRGESEEHYEAFLRMVGNDEQEVSPYDFLPPVGPTEMATKIDRWVIIQTIKHLSSHRSKGHETRLFLNLTAETIQDKTFTAWLSVALKAARLPGDSLIFQINESDTITYLKQAKEFSRGLKALHCKVSLSRFGCALNPFNTLKHVEVDYVKLDGSYTEEIQRNDETKEQVKEMVKTLQSQGKLTIVPLVENATILSTLWQAGVNYIQGYYLQAPTAEMNYDFHEQ
ncbi:MAG: EAL domain-containing protein [Hahellaceae bacterium]|nr:EAL domain-containing protein [Hahellaceae bacterium]MCP5169984.1 EAL domain-containing protein [Hahellaceae bacterium]